MAIRELRLGHYLQRRRPFAVNDLRREPVGIRTLRLGPLSTVLQGRYRMTPGRHLTTPTLADALQGVVLKSLLAEVDAPEAEDILTMPLKDFAESKLLLDDLRRPSRGELGRNSKGEQHREPGS